VSVDGKFGAGTADAVRQYQLENGLVSDGIVGEKTWSTLFRQFPNVLTRMTQKYLIEKDLSEAAAKMKVELAAIKAVNEVESSGAGFIIDQPKILFEGHIFWRQLKRRGIDPNKYKDKYPDIVYSKWTTRHYRGGLEEYDRLNAAKKIHEDAALESASWGAFQVMGFHADVLGYKSVKTFVNKMHHHEREHLDACRRYIETNNLLKALRAKDWRTFARGYNGPGYEKNGYHTKLARAYERYA
jgi:predicted N-acyltransferase